MSQTSILRTKKLIGTHVVGGKNKTKHIGKVRRFVFHPSEKRVIGMVVKRPDVAYMFRRADLFITLDGYEWHDGKIVLTSEAEATTGPSACKRMGIDWDLCTIWEGMPIQAMDGTMCGFVGDVAFESPSGTVVSLSVDDGSINKALLGQTEVPAKYIKGFRTGIGGVELNVYAEGDNSDEPEALTGAILVSNEVLGLAREGGLAQAAGEGAAIAQAQVQQTIDQAKPVVKKATKATGEAVNKGTFALGKQIGRSRGMFKAFKDEYQKAVSDEKPQEGGAIDKSKDD